MDNFLLWMWIHASKAPKIVDIQDLRKKNLVMRESKGGWDPLTGVPAPLRLNREFSSSERMNSRSATCSAPTHSHEEADKGDTATDCQVPLPDLRNRVGGSGNVEDNNPQQTDNHQGRKDGCPPHR